ARKEDFAGKYKGDDFTLPLFAVDLEPHASAVEPVDRLGRFSLVEDRLVPLDSDEAKAGAIQGARLLRHRDPSFHHSPSKGCNVAAQIGLCSERFRRSRGIRGRVLYFQGPIL